MKNKKIIIITGILIIITAFIIFVIPKISGKGNNEQQRTKDDEQILYYTCGMHPEVKSDKPGMCPICNMALIPVYKEETKRQMKDSGKKDSKKKILFYRNPMDPSITSEVPMKDSMGMDYLPVYEQSQQEEEAYYGCGMLDGTCPSCGMEAGEECVCAEHIFTIQGVKENCPICGGPLRKLSKEEVDKIKGVVSRVKIDKEQLELAGVRVQPVIKRKLFKEIRAVGKVAYDPDLVIAQEEYLSAFKSHKKMEGSLIEETKERMQGLLESSERKLKLLGMNEAQIRKLEQEGNIQSSLILPEEKMWIYADVYEYELSWVRTGAEVLVTAGGYPEGEFKGTVVSVNPVVDPKKRTIRFRAQVDNIGLKLKPEMYVDVLIRSAYQGTNGEEEALVIPKEALLDTGKRKVVWIDEGGGNYEGRVINVGLEATSLVDGQPRTFYPVLKGLAYGEQVVTKANFLIDSQSQISGIAASSYGGALGVQGQEDKPSMPAGHQH